MNRNEVLTLIDEIIDCAPWSRFEVSEKIATLLWGEPRPRGSSGQQKVLCWWDRGVGYSIPPDFLGSLDAAVKVYISEPSVIPNSPRLIVVEALRQRIGDDRA